MGVINRLDHRGHGPVAEWNKADKLSTDAAEAIFTALLAGGHTLFDISQDKSESEHRKVTAFDPDASEIIAVPRLVGG